MESHTLVTSKTTMARIDNEARRLRLSTLCSAVRRGTECFVVNIKCVLILLVAVEFQCWFWQSQCVLVLKVELLSLVCPHCYTHREYNWGNHQLIMCTVIWTMTFHYVTHLLLFHSRVIMIYIGKYHFGVKFSLAN